MNGSPKLRYDRPAREALTEGLPLGNGQLGALIWREPAAERLLLNEATLWAGGPYDGTNPEARAALPEVRALVLRGEFAAARVLAEQKLMGVPKTQAQYTPLGELLLESPEVASFGHYERELDLDAALFEELRERHLADYQPRFRRLHITTCSTRVICCSAAPALADSPPTSRASGTTTRIRLGAPSTRSISTPR